MMLRNSAFLALNTKREIVADAITFTVWLIDLLLRRTELRIVFDRDEAGYNAGLAALGRDKEDAFVSTIVVLVGNAILSVYGSGAHLEQVLDEEIERESDSFRSMVALLWRASLGSRNISSAVSKFLKTKPPYTFIMLAQLMMYSQFVSVSVFEGRTDGELRDALKTISVEAQRLRSNENEVLKASRANQSADSVVRQAETEIAMARRSSGANGGQ
jgi:signal transduction histidine kinase